MASGKALDIAKAFAHVCVDKEAEDVKVLNVSRLTTIADYFVIATVPTDVQLKVIIEEIETLSKKNKWPLFHVEGDEILWWTLIDADRVIVHLFSPEARNFYRIERIWIDAKEEKF